MTTITATPSPRVLADLVPGARVRDLVLVLIGTAVLIVTGLITVPLPFTPVPLSLSTFGVLLTGVALGPVRGASSAGLYLLLGLIGLPVFADGRAGWAFASFGYIIGYLLAAALVGVLAIRRADRSVGAAIGLAALGSLTIYLPGVAWLAAFLGIGLPEALALGVLPFLIGDAIKVLAVALLMPSAWKLVGLASRARSGDPR